MIYLIIKHCYDSMENHNPNYEINYGYVKTQDLAEEIVYNFNSNTDGKYRSYCPSIDKNLYPYLSYETINEIQPYD